jgi:hypothetical protein
MTNLWPVGQAGGGPDVHILREPVGAYISGLFSCLKLDGLYSERQHRTECEG